MKQLPVPGPGCFTASFPAIRWHAVHCHAAPDVRYLPAQGNRPFDVGNGNDYSAQVSGTISSVTGSFSDMNAGATETGNGNVTNSYSLQLNSAPWPCRPGLAPFNEACLGGVDTAVPAPTLCTDSYTPSSCQGWQQFIYSSSYNEVFIQYWLINYTSDTAPGYSGDPCPPGGPPGGAGLSPGWSTNGAGDCVGNSMATPVSTGAPTPTDATCPSCTIAQLANVSLTGIATSNTDTVTIETPTSFSAMQTPSILDLAASWNTYEWGVFGDGGGSQANFLNVGTNFGAITDINDGTTTAPSCLLEGFTGETNNLNIVDYGTNENPPPSPDFGVNETNNALAPPASCLTGYQWGDTHILTFGQPPSLPPNSNFYSNSQLRDFQASGDYVVAKSGGFVVQTQQVSGAPVWPNADMNQEIAAQIGTSDVAVCGANEVQPARLVIDGRPVNLGLGTAIYLPGGGDVALRDVTEAGVTVPGYVMRDPSGNSVVVQPMVGTSSSGTTYYMNATVGLATWPSTVSGLMANGPGNSVDSIETSSGTVLTGPEYPLTTYYDDYGASWLVPASRSLLSACGVKPVVLNPKAPFYAKDLTAAVYATAKKACVGAGVALPLLGSCEIDVAVLGATATRIYPGLPTNVTWGGITQGKGPTAPSPPTDIEAKAGQGSASVFFKPPTSNGGNATIGYTVTAANTTERDNGGQTASGPSSPITLHGLTNGDTYTLTVTATNEVGTSRPSSPSRVTPEGATITSVSFGGTQASPTITVSGSGFGTQADIGTPNPASTTENCSPATGYDYGTNFYIRDQSKNFVAGLGPPSLAAVGVKISSYSNTLIVFTVGSCYGQNGWIFDSGDRYTMYVRGASYSGTVSFLKRPSDTRG